MTRRLPRIAIVGRSGQVSRSVIEVLQAAEYDIQVFARPDFDLRDPAACANELACKRPDIVVNCAAYTQVDDAEGDPDQARLINAAAAEAIARGAAQADASIIHFSTDYVFDGTKTSPYLETDNPNPDSVYGHSKLDGEQRVALANARHVILRTAWVCSPYGRNFVKTILRLARDRPKLRVVDDQRGSPTFASDLAGLVGHIVEKLGKHPEEERLYGVFHAVNRGEATWYDLACATVAGAAKRGAVPVQVVPIGTADYPTRARRPAYSVLATNKLEAAYGITLRPWREALEDCLDRLAIETASPVECKGAVT